VAVRSNFTRIPKVSDLVLAGVPTEVIPTYCALADYSNNKTGLCWPRMETLARRLSRSPRTIQRHLHLLKEKGLVEFVERKRDWHGRFGAYVYRVVHIAAATARKRVEGVSGSSSRERRRKNAPPPDTGVLWPLLRDKLNKKKHPPNPQKRISNEAIGGSSERKPRPVPKKSTNGREKGNERRILRGAAVATSGSSSESLATYI